MRAPWKTSLGALDLANELIPPPNGYLRWRAERLQLFRFSDKEDQAPPEALLQQVWLYQRLLHENLRTSDGRPLRILHPGFWNREAGPDFRQALVQIGDAPPLSGDIEIDVVPAGWEQHSHAANPNYRQVILHVTWEPESPGRPVPSLALKDVLDSTLPELSFWLGVHPKALPEGLAGKCAAPLKALPENQVRAVLKQAGQARLRRKAEELQARARQLGWDAALWEGLFAALGYKRNVWPMRRLAALHDSLLTDLPPAESALHLQARLFGVAGFLPLEIEPKRASEAYLHSLWQIWWRDSARFREQVFPPKFWNLAGIRPPNHPHRRIALAAHWLAANSLPGKLQHWLERQIESPDLLTSLAEIFDPPNDDFWDRRSTFRSAPSASPRQLLGEQRVTDLAMNVVLPWLYVRACAGSNERLASTAESRYLLWPAGEDNSVLRLARERLFGGISAKFLRTAADQQGVLQIVRDFCQSSNAVCENCLFPELVQAVVVVS